MQVIKASLRQLKKDSRFRICSVSNEVRNYRKGTPAKALMRSMCTLRNGCQRSNKWTNKVRTQLKETRNSRGVHNHNDGSLPVNLRFQKISPELGRHLINQCYSRQADDQTVAHTRYELSQPECQLCSHQLENYREWVSLESLVQPL